MMIVQTKQVTISLTPITSLNWQDHIAQKPQDNLSFQAQNKKDRKKSYKVASRWKTLSKQRLNAIGNR